MPIDMLLKEYAWAIGISGLTTFFRYFSVILPIYSIQSAHFSFLFYHLLCLWIGANYKRTSKMHSIALFAFISYTRGGFNLLPVTLQNVTNIQNKRPMKISYFKIYSKSYIKFIHSLSTLCTIINYRSALLLFLIRLRQFNFDFDYTIHISST